MVLFRVNWNQVWYEQSRFVSCSLTSRQRFLKSRWILWSSSLHSPFISLHYFLLNSLGQNRKGARTHSSRWHVWQISHSRFVLPGEDSKGDVDSKPPSSGDDAIKAAQPDQQLPTPPTAAATVKPATAASGESKPTKSSSSTTSSHSTKSQQKRVASPPPAKTASKPKRKTPSKPIRYWLICPLKL